MLKPDTTTKIHGCLQDTFAIPGIHLHVRWGFHQDVTTGSFKVTLPLHLKAVSGLDLPKTVLQGFRRFNNGFTIICADFE